MRRTVLYCDLNALRISNRTIVLDTVTFFEEHDIIAFVYLYFTAHNKLHKWNFFIGVYENFTIQGVYTNMTRGIITFDKERQEQCLALIFKTK